MTKINGMIASQTATPTARTERAASRAAIRDFSCSIEKVKEAEFWKTKRPTQS